MNTSISQTRRYIAICNKAAFDGVYLRSFTLPQGRDNNSDEASRYFLSDMNWTASIQGCITEEDAKDLREETSMAEEAMADIAAAG